MPNYTIYYTEGNSNGPYDVFLSGSGGLTLYGSNIQQYQLENGFLITFPDGIPSSSVVIYDMSYGCASSEIAIFPTPTPTRTPTISPTPTTTPQPSTTPTPTPTRTPTISTTPSSTPPPSITATPTTTPTPSVSPGLPTPTPSVTRTPSVSPPSPVNKLWVGTSIQPTAYLACYAAVSPGYTEYYYTSMLGPGNGNTIYLTSSTCCPVIGGPGYIKMELADNVIGPTVPLVYWIDTNGIIKATYECVD